jgi:tetratricopeptide (TPR) repeat protein
MSAGSETERALPRRGARRALAGGGGVVLLAALLGLLARIVVAIALRDAPVFRAPVLDPAVYDRWARDIAAGALWPREPFHLAPLYPYLCALVYALAPDGPLAVVVLQHAAGVALTVAAGAAGLALAGPTAGAAAALLTALYGPLVLTENLLLPEVLGGVLLAVSVWLAARAAAVRAASARAALGAGCACGLAALVRPTALAILVALAAWFLARGPGARSTRRRAAGALLLGAMLAVLPVTLVNRIGGGDWVLITASGGFNFYVGNHAAADGGYVQPEGVAFAPGDRGDPTGRGAAERALGRPLGARGVSDYWLGRAFSWIRAEPARALALYAKKVALLWNRAEIPQIVDRARVAAEVPRFGRLPLVGPWLLLPLALLGLAIGLPARRESAILRVTLVAFTLATALFFVTERYRVQVVPLLAVLAGAGAAWLARTARRRSPRSLALAAAALVAAALATDPHWFGLAGRLGDPWVAPLNRALALIRASADSSDVAQAFAEAAARGPAVGRVYANRGEWYRQRGNLPAAAADLARALALDPDDPVAWSARGALEAARGDSAARGSFARALALDPAYPPAALGLGQALLRAREPAAAVAPLRAALAGPDSAAAHDALGVALLMTGESGEGFFHLTRAVALAPDRAIFRLHLGLALAEAGRPDAAAREIEAALVAEPRHRAARLAAALLARDRGDTARARAHLDTLLSDRPADREALELRAALDAR